MLEIVPLGDCALRCTLPGGIDRRAAFELLKHWPLVIDAVVTERHACITFDPTHPPAPPWDALEGPLPPLAERPRRHLIRVRYDGEDLAEVAAAAKLSIDEVIQLHMGRVYQVLLIGFLPGFAYCGEVDPKLQLSRRPTPRPRVPAHAVAIAARYTGVYPLASPGGWHLLGTAIDFAPFSAATGSLWSVGDRVQFAAAE